MSDRLPLDHFVYAVPDLEQAIDDLAARLGVRASLGGKHEAFGTHNAILPLDGERYLELIALDPQNPNPAQQVPFGLDSLDVPRIVTWAVRSRDIESDVEHARQAGFDPGLVLDVTRKQPDGETLQWKLSLKPEPFGDGLIPFVIDWEQSAHPARLEATGGPRGTLDDCFGTHPEAEGIREALQALGVALEVRSGPAPELHVTLSGPAGSLELC